MFLSRVNQVLFPKEEFCLSSHGSDKFRVEEIVEDKRRAVHLLLVTASVFVRFEEARVYAT